MIECCHNIGSGYIKYGNNSRRCTAWGAAGVILPFIYNKDLCYENFKNTPKCNQEFFLIGEHSLKFVLTAKRYQF